MKRICPGSLQYAIMRIDPVSTVAHFADADASKDAQALNTKKYLVYLDHVRLHCQLAPLLPSHVNGSWGRMGVRGEWESQEDILYIP